jgi:hypothetical protein
MGRSAWCKTLVVPRSVIGLGRQRETNDRPLRGRTTGAAGLSMAEMKDLMREYERARFPPERRLDIHGEGPRIARDRVLRWIQSRSHETPGAELLLIVGRGDRPGRQPGPVEAAVRSLLAELEGRLIEWWQPFAPGSLAVRIAADPRMTPIVPDRPVATGDGRTPETAGAARPSPAVDIPAELLETARRAADLRIEREGLSIRLVDVVLREVWIEAQARAMEVGTTFEAAIAEVYAGELGRSAEDG